MMQIASIGLMGVSAVCVKHYFEELSTLKASVVVILAFSTPFYLQNFSYKFDALPMTASLFLAFLAPLSLKAKNVIIALFFFSTCALCSLMLYQASFNALISITTAYMIINIFLKKGVKKNHLLVVFLGSIIALLLYKITLPFWLVENDYSKTHSETLAISEFIHGYYNNWINLNRYAFSNMSGIYKIGFCILLFYTTAHFAFRLLSKPRLSSKAILLQISLIFLILLLSVGILGILKSPVYQPRVFFGYSGVLVFICIYLSIFVKHPFTSISLNFIFILIVFHSSATAFVYGNTLSYLNTINSQSLGYAMQQINHYAKNHNAKKISIIGQPEFPAVVQKARNNIPIIKEILPSYLDGYWIGGITTIAYGKSEHLQYVRYKNAFDSSTATIYCTVPADYESYEYDIRTVNDITYIDFERRCDS